MKRETNFTVPASNPIDVHVGLQIRARRRARGMSQEDLGRALNLSFQQVQKYERGSNRVSASRLYDIAQALGVGMPYFFETYRDGVAADIQEIAPERTAHAFLLTTEGVALAEAFPRVKNPKVRRKVADLIRAVAAESEDGS